MSAHSSHSSPSQRHACTRRRFLAQTGAGAVAFTILKPSLLGGATANSKLQLGLIGCGGRGQWIADLFQKHGGFAWMAAADYFKEKVDGMGDKFNVPANRRFTGLHAYRRLLEQKLDAVVIESPPYFHPEHAAAAVEAGKHVYLAKPVAVDVPGCRTIEESGRHATERNQCFLVDFQTRAHPFYQEVVKRVQQGMIGRVVSIDAGYQCGPTWEHMDSLLRQDPSNPEVRLRAWGVDRTLSGDVITEQNIHALDVATWFLDAHPERAYGTGGRSRDFLGDCWDHFAVVFHFPGEIPVSFSSKQVGMGYDDILCRVYGLTGTADTHYFGKVNVRSKDDGYGGEIPNLYSDGVVRNIATFYDHIISNDYSNTTVAPSVRSNLTTILGRSAAYAGGEVTWKEIMAANKKLEADLKGLKS